MNEQNPFVEAARALSEIGYDRDVALMEVERLQAENAALREIAQAVVSLEEGWIGTDDYGGHGYRSDDVEPIKEHARALLAKSS